MNEVFLVFKQTKDCSAILVHIIINTAVKLSNKYQLPFNDTLPVHYLTKKAQV